MNKIGNIPSECTVKHASFSLYKCNIGHIFENNDFTFSLKNKARKHKIEVPLSSFCILFASELFLHFK